MQNRPNVEAAQSGYYNSSFCGVLEKKSRHRTLLSSKDHWTTRNFRLEGQMLRYYTKQGVEKGFWCTAGAETSKLKKLQTKESSEYGFVVKFKEVHKGTIHQPEEIAYFIADSQESRSKWMSHINASSLSEKMDCIKHFGTEKDWI